MRYTEQSMPSLQELTLTLADIETVETPLLDRLSARSKELRASSDPEQVLKGWYIANVLLRRCNQDSDLDFLVADDSLSLENKLDACVAFVDSQKNWEQEAKDIRAVFYGRLERARRENPDKHILLVLNDLRLRSPGNTSTSNEEIRILLYYNQRALEAKELAAAEAQEAARLSSKIKRIFNAARWRKRDQNAPLRISEEDLIDTNTLYWLHPSTGCGIKSTTLLKQGLQSGRVVHFVIDPVPIEELRKNVMLSSYEDTHGVVRATGWDRKGANEENQQDWLTAACLGEFQTTEYDRAVFPAQVFL